MSLPLVFETRTGSVPNKTPCVCRVTNLVRAWRERLGSSGLKIGVCWQGNSKHQKVDGRRFSPTYLAPLTRLEGVRLISLQKDEAIPAGLAIESIELSTFTDTAAIMTYLDLVISVDTSVAHLAGALGLPTWLVLQQVPDWRWMTERPDSPWYPGMKLFRQKSMAEVETRV